MNATSWFPAIRSSMRTAWLRRTLQVGVLSGFVALSNGCLFIAGAAAGGAIIYATQHHHHDHGVAEDHQHDPHLEYDHTH